MTTPDQTPAPVSVPAVPHGVEIPPEPPEIGARALYIAARLLAGATTFFFVAFLFAFFYLRSLNQNGKWMTAHVHPDKTVGIVIVICVVLSAVAAYIASRHMRREHRGWLIPAIISILLGLAAVVVQAIAYGSQGFGPTDGAYASVYVGWTAFFMVAVICTLYWLETQVATELRARRDPAHSKGDISDPDQLIEPGLAASSFFWGYLAAVGVVTYAVLYLV